MTAAERALTFDCEGERLTGILSGAAAARRGVLIVVGGPQYRAGSHRQFTLLARHLAEEGIPALRFDYRGMGDSSGPLRSFEETAADIRCAMDRMFEGVEGLQDVVIWGLCDAASAALFYAHRDRRVSGLVLLNPWVRTAQGEAQAYLRHYYLARVLDPELWRRMARGEFGFRAALASLIGHLRGALGAAPAAPASAAAPGPAAVPAAAAAAPAEPLPERMADGLARFRGNVLLILSGNDLTAQEFRDVTGGSRRWRRLLAAARTTRCELAAANHTFSKREWRDQVARWTAQWVKSW